MEIARNYFAFQDAETSLYWLVPCSSKIEKFERILEQKKERHKPTDTIRIVTIQDKKTALLFQDMFPVTAGYIDGPMYCAKTHQSITDFPFSCPYAIIFLST